MACRCLLCNQVFTGKKKESAHNCGIVIEAPLEPPRVSVADTVPANIVGADPSLQLFADSCSPAPFAFSPPPVSLRSVSPSPRDVPTVAPHADVVMAGEHLLGDDIHHSIMSAAQSTPVQPCKRRRLPLPLTPGRMAITTSPIKDQLRALRAHGGVHH